MVTYAYKPFLTLPHLALIPPSPPELLTFGEPVSRKACRVRGMIAAGVLALTRRGHVRFGK